MPSRDPSPPVETPLIGLPPLDQFFLAELSSPARILKPLPTRKVTRPGYLGAALRPSEGQRNIVHVWLAHGTQ